MSLMSLVRWIGVIVIGWTLLAIGIGASGARLPRRESARPLALGIADGGGDADELADRAGL